MIIIAGDSWSVGEWANFRIQHNGLAQYLHDHNHTVINLSRGKFSNGEAINLLSYFLDTNPYLIKNISHIIFFQTEWTRDLDHMSQEQVESNLSNGYQELKYTMLTKTYQGLNFLCEKYGVKILLVGGCSDVQWSDDFNQDYPGLEIACQSMTNLLTNHDHRIDQPVYTVFLQTNQDLVKLIYNRVKSDDLKILLDDVDLSHKRLAVWKNPQGLFWPDGAHANRHGHKMLFDFLKQQGHI